MSELLDVIAADDFSGRARLWYTAHLPLPAARCCIHGIGRQIVVGNPVGRTNMAAGIPKSLLIGNAAACLLGTSLFLVHTGLSVGRVYGPYATEFSVAFVPVILLCSAVALAFSILAFVAFVSACLRRQWGSLGAATAMFATVVLPLPAMIAVIRVGAGLGKAWIMAS